MWVDLTALRIALMQCWGVKKRLHNGLHVSVCKTGSDVWSIGSSMLDASLSLHVCQFDRPAQLPT